ncbi:MAG: HAD family hydrolase [Elusimicrobiales bacterium]
MSSKTFDLIIFDMDGTLLDSMTCLADWLHRAVKDHCPASVTPATITSAFGPTEKQIITQFVPKDLVQLCLNAYYDLYEREHDRVFVYPGIDKLLEAVRNQGVPMALCTGKSRRAVEISLNRLGWRSHFQTVITGDDTTRFKPDPEGLNLILGQIPAARKRTIFIGDSPADTEAARNAGVISGRAEWGLHVPKIIVQSDYGFTTTQAVIGLLSGTIT